LRLPNAINTCASETVGVGGEGECGDAAGQGAKALAVLYMDVLFFVCGARQGKAAGAYISCCDGESGKRAMCSSLVTGCRTVDGSDGWL